MIKTLTYNQIDPQQWQALIDRSPYATWFQTPEAYEFYAAVSGMQAFAYGVAEEGRLVGVIVGYNTQEKCIFKQYFIARTIIPGGPLLSKEISNQALSTLLLSLNEKLANTIYIESRNYNDYSAWKSVFESCGFIYNQHLNFHVDTTSLDQVQSRIGKHRWRYIRLSMRDGAQIVEHPTLEQVRAFYTILQDLYRTKVRTPLWSWEFFERLYHTEHAR